MSCISTLVFKNLAILIFSILLTLHFALPMWVLFGLFLHPKKHVLYPEFHFQPDQDKAVTTDKRKAEKRKKERKHCGMGFCYFLQLFLQSLRA